MIPINTQIKNQLKLVCNDFISVNHYMSYRVIKKKVGAKTFNVVMAYKPQETIDFENKFGEYAKEEITKQGWIKPPKDKLIILDTVFYLPRIDMDAQNYFKSLCDVMTTSGVWKDDNIVMERVNRIYYDADNPRIELNVFTSDYIGIFEDEEDYYNFVNTYCNNCTNGNKIGEKGGCTVYKNALENRIQEEIDMTNKSCLKFKKKKNKSKK